MRKYIEVESQEQAQKILQGHSCVEKTAFQCVDFTQFIVEVENVSFRDCLFLGCKFTKSMHYNPFAYIRSEKDILKLVNTIIVNTKGEGQQSGEDFWVKAEKLYYTALIAYIWYEAPEEEQNFAMLIDMIDASEAREDDENFKNAVDLLFEELEADKPNHFAVRQYKKYKLAAGVITYKRLLMMFIG